MNITLSPATQKRLKEYLNTGEYPSADAVVIAGLNALDMLSTLRPDTETLDAIDRAEDQIEQGNVHDWNIVRNQIRAKFHGA